MTILSLLLVLSTAAEGPRVPAAIATREGLEIVMATGPIDAGFSERLRVAVERNPAATVLEIESPGGLADQAYKSAELLNDRGITVRVRGRCASACALLWASSESRALIEGAQIGLHLGKPSSKPPRFLRSLVQRYSYNLAKAALVNAGFSQELIGRALSTPHSSMLWLDVEAAKDAGAVFDRLPRGHTQSNRGAPNKSFKPTPLRSAA